MTEEEIFEELDEARFQEEANGEGREEYEERTNGINPEDCY